MVIDRIITVCLNPSLDQTIWVDKLDLEEPVSAIKEKVYAGGKGINVSRVLTSLSIPNHSITVVGDLNSRTLTSLLNSEGVDYTIIKAQGLIRENLSIVLPDERLFKINRKGFSVNTQIIAEVEQAIGVLLANTTNPLIVFAGSLPQNMTAQQYKALIMRFRNEDVNVCIDTDIFTEQDIIDIKPYIIKPNHIELSHIAQRELTTAEQVREYAHTLTPYVSHIIVSLGKQGLHYLSKSESHSYTPPDVEVKSTVGAGDTTLSGFITALYQNKPIDECVKFAGICGTASVTLPGTAIITNSDIEYINNLMN